MLYISYRAILFKLRLLDPKRRGVGEGEGGGGGHNRGAEKTADRMET